MREIAEIVLSLAAVILELITEIAELALSLVALVLALLWDVAVLIAGSVRDCWRWVRSLVIH
jgi:hypothetical protein